MFLIGVLISSIERLFLLNFSKSLFQIISLNVICMRLDLVFNMIVARFLQLNLDVF